MLRWRPFFTLVKREAWEYRDWWTYVMGACLLAGVVGIGVLEWTQPMAGDDGSGFRDAFFLRWFHGLMLVGGGILALAHAAHGVYDERQDRSIGFWQSWPVPESTRLLAKSTAIAFGWPLIGVVASTILTIVLLLASFVLGKDWPYYDHILAMWLSLVKASALAGAWAWPAVCGWLWCSTNAKTAPWAWGVGVAALVYAAAWSIGIDGTRLALAIALGPALAAVSSAVGEPGLLPWAVGSIGWLASCLAGWAALVHAARNIGDAAHL